MSHILETRVAETTTSTGTGDVTLGGALTAHRAFADVCGTGDTTEYVIYAVDTAGAPTGDWEEGKGTYSAANTLTRTTVTRSSNSNSAVTFTAGTKIVILTPLGSRVGAIPQGGNTGQVLSKSSTNDMELAWIDTPASVTVDAAPTDGSANAVSSNGVFDALAGKADTSHNHSGTYQPLATVLTNTTASFTTAQETKLGHITVTQAVDLDAIESRVNELDAAVILKGVWDASAGTFPGAGAAQAGWSYIVSIAGTVDGTAFAVGDRAIAITDNASTSTFAGNWFKADYTDQVLSVAGRTGAVTLTSADLTDTTTAGRALLDDADAAAQRTTLGLGDAATKNTGTTTGTVAAGDDSRLTNSRTPTAHKTSHATGGSDALTAADIGGIPTGGLKTVNGNALEGSGDISISASIAPLVVEDANTVAQRNGTNAQKQFVYNTYTDASNYERGFMRWNSNVLEIGAEKAGTGAQRALSLAPGLTRTGTVKIFDGVRGELSIASTALDGGDPIIAGSGTSQHLRIQSNGSGYLYLNRNGLPVELGAATGNVTGVCFSGLGGAGGVVADFYSYNGSTVKLILGGRTLPANAQDAPTDSIIQARDRKASDTEVLVGGYLKIVGGKGASDSSGAAHGGAIYLDGGQGYGTGSHGDVIVGNTRGNLQVKGSLAMTGVAKLASFTVATLPSASTSGAGATALVTDANATTARSTVAGGGSNKVLVFSDGTNWLITA